MGSKKYLSSEEVEGRGRGKSCSLVATVAIAVLVAAVVALAVGLGVGLGKKCNCKDSMTPSSNDTLTTNSDITTPRPPPTGDEVLLPKALQATHYDLKIRPNFSHTADPASFLLNGNVMIHFDVKTATDEIVVHAKNLNIPTDKVVVMQGVEKINVLSGTDDPRLEFHTIKLDKLLTVGKVTAYMEFSGPIRNDLVGIYYSSYNDNGQTRYLLASHMQPTDARKVFPCMDEPALKATFDITIERRSELKTLSNTVIYRNETLTDGWVADHYETTPRMSTYILAFLVGQFECLENTTTSGQTVLICARPNAIQQGHYANSIAATIQDFFVDFYKIPYPLNRTVHVAVPDFAAGAMENWGCIIYRETALLYDREVSTAVNKQRVAVVIAHELAHMWFGNLVTPAWWDDIWLNEGFASYMEYDGVNSAEPTWKMHEQFLPEDLHSVFRTDALTTSHPIHQEVSHPDQINELFDSISYSKGASVIRMMYFFLGHDIFTTGITNYLRKYSFSVATNLDLFRVLSETSADMGRPVDVTRIMLTWISEMGYPVVHMSYDNDTGRVTLNQTRFLLIPPSNPGDIKDHLWALPVTVATKGSDFNASVTNFIFDRTGMVTVSSGAEWIVGNAYERYYYRVTYDESMWTALINQLLKNHEEIIAENRAQLIDDSFSLARPGVVNQVLALNVSQYLNVEMEYVPWTAAGSNFGYIRRMLAQTETLELLEKYMQRQVQNAYDSVGWTETADDEHLKQRLRSLVVDLACLYGNTTCHQEASRQFDLLIANSNTVGVNVRSTAYCYGISNGGIREWQDALEKYNASNLGTEQIMILQALACTQDAFLLAEYLEMARQEVMIRRQDFATVIISVSRNRNGQQLAWDFLRINWDDIYTKFSLFSLTNIVSGVTESFSTPARLRELEAFISVNKDKLGSAERAAQQAVESTKANIAWRSVNEVSVKEWLQEHV